MGVFLPLSLQEIVEVALCSLRLAECEHVEANFLEVAVGQNVSIKSQQRKRTFQMHERRFNKEQKNVNSTTWVDISQKMFK